MLDDLPKRDYLLLVYPIGNLTPSINISMGLLHVVNDIERVGDHAVNLGNFASYKWESRMEFSDEVNLNLLICSSASTRSCLTH